MSQSNKKPAESHGAFQNSYGHYGQSLTQKDRSSAKFDIGGSLYEKRAQPKISTRKIRAEENSLASKNKLMDIEEEKTPKKRHLRNQEREAEKVPTSHYGHDRSDNFSSKSGKMIQYVSLKSKEQPFQGPNQCEQDETHFLKTLGLKEKNSWLQIKGKKDEDALLKALGYLFIRKSLNEGTLKELHGAISNNKFPHKEIFFPEEYLNSFKTTLHRLIEKLDRLDQEKKDSTLEEKIC